MHRKPVKYLKELYQYEWRKTGTVKSESLSLQLSMAKQQGEKAIQLTTKGHLLHKKKGIPEGRTKNQKDRAKSLRELLE